MPNRKLTLLVSMLLLPAAAADLHAVQRRAQRVSPLSDSIRAVTKRPASAVRAAFTRFAASQGAGWKVRYSARTGLPEAVTGGRTTRRYSGTPEQAAVAFLGENKSMLSVATETLKLANKKEFLGITHIQYQQYYKGIPVEFSYARVHVSADGSVAGYQGRFEPDLNVNTVPSVSAGAAAAAAVADLGAQLRVSKSELVIYPDETSGAMKLAWKLRGRGGNGVWVYYVDAASGSVLFKYDDLRYASCPGSAMSWNTVGVSSATVYAISPLPDYDSNSIYIVEDNWTRPVQKGLRDQYVWVGGYSSSTVTNAYGNYCTQTSGKMFASLKGPYFNVANFRGGSAHYDNGGGEWRTYSNSAQTPHPYAVSTTYSYTVPSAISSLASLLGSGEAFAKAMPRFSSFEVGELDIYGSSYDTDQAYVKYSKDGVLTTAGAYTGTRTSPFYGAAVESPSYTVTLESDGSGTYNGFTVDISSYLVLTNSPSTTNNATGSVIWSTSTAGVYFDRSIGDINALSEVNAFYHLNSAHRYFDAINIDTNGNPAADLSKQVAVMAHAHGNADMMGQSCGTACGGMLNAFYDMEKDNIMLGDGPVDSHGLYRSFALDGTIIRHEYVHLVTGRIYPIINFGEFGALSEGLADYFSLASFWKEGYTSQKVLGNFIGYGEASSRDISGSNNPTTTRVMPDDWYGEVHEDGLILSQSLYQLGNPSGAYYLGNLSSGYFSGQRAADVLAYAALFYFPDNFSNYRDAMLDACTQLETSAGCTAAMRTKIVNAFSAHGIGAAAGGGDSYETSAGTSLCDNNNGPECASDIASLSSVSATVYPLGDLDYYSLPLSEGVFTARLDLPAGSVEDTYNAYAMFLFDADRNYVTESVPVIYNTYTGYCPMNSTVCNTLSPYITLSYSVPSGGGRYYLVVSGAPNEYYGNSDVNSLTPYTLTLARTPKGSATARIYTSSYDNDEISFDVPYTSFAMDGSPSSSTLTGAETVFQYAQLRDHNYDPIDLTRTNASGSYLKTVGLPSDFTLGKDALDRPIISGRVRLQPGFGARFPGVGTVYLELFGRNHLGSVVSLGVSGALNLTANASGATAYNNIITSGSSALIKCELQSAGTLSIKVYTQTGALVKTVYDGAAASGKSTYEWDGTNSSGGKAASGIYFVKIKGPGVNKLDKIAVVR